MTIQAFKESITESNPPAGISDYLKALWYDAQGKWDEAHTIIQDIGDKNASLIHAYLHRKEGDVSNAGYWYHRAGKNTPSCSLDSEWEEILTMLL